MKKMDYEGGDKALSVRFPWALYVAAKKHAEEAGMSMAKLISVALENEIERAKGENTA